MALDEIGFAAAASCGCCETDGGPHAFAAGEKRIAHRGVDGAGFCFGRWQKLVERGVDGGGAGFEEVLEVEGFDFARCGHAGFGLGNEARGCKTSCAVN